MFVSVTNLNLGNFEIKSSGKLIDYVVASCAVPLLFKPIKIEGYLYVDGGLLNTLPVESLLNISDKIIGISVSGHRIKEDIKGALQITERCLRLSVWNTIQERIKECDVFLDIDKDYTYSMFAFKNADELFNIGYETTIKNMDVILRTIQ